MATQQVICDIYCRVSTDIQEDNTSLDEQEACARKYCKEHGLIIGMVHREVFSGYQYREREQLGLMRERYREGKIQSVIIRTLDRLSRSQVHNAILMEAMEHHKVTLYCVKDSSRKWTRGAIHKILSDPRRTGKDAQAFTRHHKDAKKPFEAVACRKAPTQ